MFKKRSKASQAAASPREQRLASPKSVEESSEPSARRQSSHERAKLSLAELHLRYGNGETQEPETFEELDDDWEDEQLRKNGVFVEKPVRFAASDDDSFAEVKERIRQRISALQHEAESLEHELVKDML